MAANSGPGPLRRAGPTSASLIGRLRSSAFRLSPPQCRCRSRARASLRNRHQRPCMGFSLSRSWPGRRSFPSSVSLFDLKARFFVPTRSSARPSRAGAVKVGRYTNLSTRFAFARPYLDSFEHDGTLAAIGMTIRGEPAFGRGSVAPQPRGSAVKLSKFRFRRDRHRKSPQPQRRRVQVGTGVQTTQS